MKATAGGAVPLLFTPISLRGITSRNRIVVPPMCQYSAENGYPTDWHFAHLSHFAMGGAGIVFTEASAVEARGRITHGDLGIWEDGQAEALKRIAGFLKQQGAVPGIQLAHAGRKASMQRPWEGNGPLDDRDAARGEHPWDIVGTSSNPVGPGWLIPHQLTKAEIAEIVGSFARAAQRADAAGFEVIEIHGAHGYLIHTFLSPLANMRKDDYGGERRNRMRFAIEVAAAVRGAWPAKKPLFFRISAVDWEEGGWTIEDSVALAKALKAEGVDVIDCSSGGIAGPATAATATRHLGFQVPFAEQVALEADVMTQAVGLIMEGRFAEEILQKQRASLVAVARQALFDPFWPIHAAKELNVDANFESWPHYYGWWLNRRSRVLTK